MEDRAGNVLKRLKSVREVGARKWMALCPAHEDKEPSLGIAVGEDGRVLLHCFAGCSAESVVKAIGVEMKDLFPSGCGERTQTHPITVKAPLNKSATVFGTEEGLLACVQDRVKGVHVATWRYDGIDGVEALRVARFSLPDGGKAIRPYHKEPLGWTLGDPPGPLPLYNLPKIEQASRVYVLEGEKCADIAGRLAGH